MKRLTSGLLVLAMGLFLSNLSDLILPIRAAGNVRMYLSPATESVKVGENKTFSIMLDTGGETIYAASAIVEYDATKLSFISEDSSGSAFNTPAPSQITSGRVKFDRGHTGGLSGNVEITKVTFRAATTGSTSLTVGSDSKAMYGAENKLTSRAGASVTIINNLTPPPPTPAPTPPVVTTPPPTTPPKSATVPKTTHITTKTKTVGTAPSVVTASPNVQKTSQSSPTISNIKASIGFKSIEVMFATDKPTKAVVEYGPTGSLGLSASEPTSNSQHSIRLNAKELKPGMSYYYRIKVIGASGETTTTELVPFIMKGYAVRVLIKDKQGRPVKNLAVLLNSDPRPGTTDSQGIVTYDDVAPGKHTVTGEYDGQKFAKEIKVDDLLNITKKASIDNNATIPVQTFALSATTGPGLDFKLILIFIGAVIGLCLLVFIVIKILHRNKNAQTNRITTVDSNGQSRELKENIYDPKSAGK